MKFDPQNLGNEFLHRLKLLMFFRILFSSFLLGATIIFQVNRMASLLSPSLVALYGLTASIFLISFIYALLINRLRQNTTLAYIQIIMDTFVISAIILVTGGISSIFSFLYLLVIIYASILFYNRGSMIIAVISSIQYGVMVGLEYFGILYPFTAEAGFVTGGYSWVYVLYKVIMTLGGCFVVAFLSGFLSEKERKTKRELIKMEAHVKRVDKLAALGEVAAGLAHEIKNPLASLTGSIQLIRDDHHDRPEHRKLMEIVLREADRLSTLVNNFLLFARPPTGKSEKLNLSHILSETIEMFEKDAVFADKISLNKKLLPNLWFEMDPGHFRQILWNLLLNAAEAIQDQGSISIHVQPYKGNFIDVLVIDDGCGIPEAELASIFYPFFTTKSNGSGLGLSIVHSIVESYQCHLDVNSRVKEGTTVTLRLKRADAPSDS